MDLILWNNVIKISKTNNKIHKAVLLNKANNKTPVLSKPHKELSVNKLLRILSNKIVLSKVRNKNKLLRAGKQQTKTCNATLTKKLLTTHAPNNRVSKVSSKIVLANKAKAKIKDYSPFIKPKECNSPDLRLGLLHFYEVGECGIKY